MTPTGTIPVLVRPEAKARVERLEMSVAFESMLQSIPQFYDGVQRIGVVLRADPEGEDEPRVLFEVLLDAGSLSAVTANDQWSRWVTTCFSPDVFRHFNLLETYECGHEP